MYKFLLGFALVSISFNTSFAQSKTPSMEEILKKQKVMTANGDGVIKFNFDNKSYTYHCQVIKDNAGVFLFTVAFADMTTNNLNIILGSINEGKNNTFSDKKKLISTAVINGNAYQIVGTVTLNKKGKTVSGSFEFDAFLVSKKNGKADKKSAGKITGTIINVSIP